MAGHIKMSRQLRPLIGFSLLLPLLSAGCGPSATSPTAPARTDTDSIINTICPVMGGEATAEITVDWKGKKVAFCCPPCIEEWNELSDDEREAKLKRLRQSLTGKLVLPELTEQLDQPIQLWNGSQKYFTVRSIPYDWLRDDDCYGFLV